MLRPILAVLLLALAPPAAAQPGERVPLGPVALDRTEVTIGQFQAFVAATGLVTAAERAGGGQEFSGGWVRRPGWTWQSPQGAPGAPGEPAVHLTWEEARAYCAWAGGRLPRFEEWRAAAYTEQRAAPTDGFERGRTYAYPVGDDPAGMNTNRRHHLPAGTTRRGVNGLYDMGANVWEWLADRRGEEALTAGGSWWYGPAQARAEGAQWKPAGFAALYIGLRCAYGP
ncbi:formylglycine-generating enzyme family protein [Paracraurococcus ruber]|uniref:Sulfatase-modifying factor enzyme-like domain-containing protein n=1 Tax=Paracraurococcus ruber TaxID=77675 RepID=A0ABS1D6P2_9PROT|nr:formylglycine-generating enzyme family protein [Paracraurococcus ruber]MBK1662565.1 hypothetical protein [Paracraurococcus ruber]TDG07445.1 formylglycine-generating enzyme family protein [Paracraurococcus ruber]